MPRKARDQSATGIYHVMIRGINRQDIFEATLDAILGCKDTTFYPNLQTLRNI